MQPEPSERTARAFDLIHFLARFGEVQETLCALVAALDEDEHRVRFHSDFSPPD